MCGVWDNPAENLNCEMRMKVLPGSLWLAYDLRHTSQIEAMLPPHLTLCPVRFFEEEAAASSPKLLFNAYEVSSRFMDGVRCDIQVLAEHQEHGTKHLVILDVATSTMQWDPVNGIRSPNTARGTAPPPTPGSTSLHLVSLPRSPEPSTTCLRVSGHWKEGDLTPDRTFAVEGNRACYFRGSKMRFPMSFDEGEITAPVRRLSARVENGLWRRFRSERPTHAFVHPHTMSFDVHVPWLGWLW